MPPVTEVTVMLPLLFPQVEEVAEAATAEGPAIFEIVTEVVIVQVFASLAVRVYVFAAKPENVVEDWKVVPLIE